MTITGRRIENPDNFTNAPIVLPGDYWKDKNGQWNVTEHEDRTITVNPSIFWGSSGYPNSPSEWSAKHTWHGWLEHGIWRTA